MFYHWLMRQRTRPDLVGLFARAVRNDKNFPKRSHQLYILLRYYNGSHPAIRSALKRAHREWRRVRGYEALVQEPTVMRCPKCKRRLS